MPNPLSYSRPLIKVMCVLSMVTLDLTATNCSSCIPHSAKGEMCQPIGHLLHPGIRALAHFDVRSVLQISLLSMSAVGCACPAVVQCGGSLEAVLYKP